VLPFLMSIKRRLWPAATAMYVIAPNDVGPIGFTIIFRLNRWKFGWRKARREVLEHRSRLSRHYPDFVAFVDRFGEKGCVLSLPQVTTDYKGHQVITHFSCNSFGHGISDRAASYLANLLPQVGITDEELVAALSVTTLAVDSPS
jgi:hypothetical protein